MEKTIKVIQAVSRLLLIIVGTLLIAGALFFTGVHMANKNLEKTETSGIIIKGDEGLHEVSYEFDGKNFQQRPLDTYLRDLGTVGEKVEIFVVNDHPERIFSSYHGDELMRTSGIMAGWGLLLLILFFGERQLMKRMKTLEKLADEDEDKEE